MIDHGSAEVTPLFVKLHTVFLCPELQPCWPPAEASLASPFGVEWVVQGSHKKQNPKDIWKASEARPGCGGPVWLRSFLVSAAGFTETPRD
jgi:hypothetical protein